MTNNTHHPDPDTAQTLAPAAVPPLPLVENLILPGLTVLVGRPKAGKSWLALQLAVAVATGRPFLDRPTLPPRPVHYFDLEAGPERLARRLAALGLPPDAPFRTETVLDPLAAEGANYLDALLRIRKPALLVLDSLSAAWATPTLPPPAVILPTLHRLRSLAAAHHAAILLVDHDHRPRPALNPSPLAALAAGPAQAAAVDSILHLKPAPGHPAILAVLGRDLPDQTLHLTFDLAAGPWQPAPAPDHFSDPDADPEFNPDGLTYNHFYLLDRLADNGPMRLADLARSVNQDPANTLRRLQRLASLDQVTTCTIDGITHYCLTPHLAAQIAADEAAWQASRPASPFRVVDHTMPQPGHSTHTTHDA